MSMVKFGPTALHFGYDFVLLMHFLGHPVQPQNYLHPPIWLRFRYYPSKTDLELKTGHPPPNISVYIVSKRNRFSHWFFQHWAKKPIGIMQPLLNSGHPSKNFTQPLPASASTSSILISKSQIIEFSTTAELWCWTEEQIVFLCRMLCIFLWLCHKKCPRVFSCVTEQISTWSFYLSAYGKTKFLQMGYKSITTKWLHTFRPSRTFVCVYKIQSVLLLLMSAAKFAQQVRSWEWLDNILHQLWLHPPLVSIKEEDMSWQNDMTGGGRGGLILLVTP